MADQAKKRTKDAPWSDRDDRGRGSEPERAEGDAHLDRDDMVDEASDESFPASDPPSFTPTKLGSGSEPNEHGVERERPTGDDRRSDDVERETP